MSIQKDHVMNLEDGQVLYNDLRDRIKGGEGAGNVVLVQDTQPTASGNKVWITATPPQSVQVPTMADFSGLSDVVAPDYADLTFPVSKGQHCIYEGGYYEANQAISTSEDWTSAHWTNLGSVHPP